MDKFDKNDFDSNTFFFPVLRLFSSVLLRPLSGRPAHRQIVAGLRPEHITEAKQHSEPGVETFDTVLDVTEPMGMETLIYFTMEGSQVCGRVNPNAGARDGGPLRLAVDLNNMHLLNEVTGVVL